MKKILKWMLIIIVTIFAIIGTFSGQRSGLWPLYVKKSDVSLGINSVVVNELRNGTLYGINIGGFSELSQYKIYGMDLNLLGSANSGYYSQIYGAEISGFLNFANIGGEGMYRKVVDGLQTSLIYNSSDTPERFLIQIGLINVIRLEDGSHRASFLINVYIKGLIE